MRLKEPVKVAGSAILGFFIGYFLYNEGKYIANYIVPKENIFLSNIVQILSLLTAIFIFGFIFGYFSFNNHLTLTAYYLFSVCISTIVIFMAVYFIMLAAVRFITPDMLSDFFKKRYSEFWGYNILFIVVIVFVAGFSGIFSFITRNKIKYIKYISKEVKLIESEGFGRTLKVTGSDELAELCTCINYMSKELYNKTLYEKQIELKKNELITNVSHDLRSPLTSIIGYVGLIKELGVSDTEKFNEYIEVVDRRLKGLNNLINELFELTKLKGNDVKLDLEEIDISALLNHILCENILLLQKDNFKVKDEIMKEEYFIKLDSQKFVRAMQNLFDNAKKYAKENSEITLSSFKEADGIHIQMSNYIKEGNDLQVENIFDRFYKGDVSRSDTQSSGLGLAIVKSIIVLHGGNITADVKDDKLMFEIVLKNS